jgi:uncharacterized membrane protein
MAVAPQAAGEDAAMNPSRFLRHLSSARWITRRRFTPTVLAQIETAIRETEALHAGEIRFAVETALDTAALMDDLAPRRRAMQVFGQLGVWDTAQNNGVLIYLLLADHVVEIVADRGIAARIAQSEWDGVCREMERHYRQGRFGEGSVAGVRGVGSLLARHFPGRPAVDELPNQPVLL